MNTKLSELGSSVFLTGSIIFANLDFASITDYAIKAFVGGAVWMGFKLAGDYFTKRFKSSDNV